MQSCIPLAYHASCLFHRTQKITTSNKRKLLSAMAKAPTLNQFIAAKYVLEQTLTAEETAIVFNTPVHEFCLSHMIETETELIEHWSQCDIKACKFSWVHYAGASRESNPLTYIHREVVFARSWGHLSNQMSESFNNIAKVLGIRGKNVLSCLHACYAYSLKVFIQLEGQYLKKYDLNVIPAYRIPTNSVKLLSRRKLESIVLSRCVDRGAFSGEVLSQSHSEGYFFHAVFLQPRGESLTGSCSCRSWNVKGRPCKHSLKIAEDCCVPGQNLFHPLLTVNAGVVAFTEARPFNPIDTANLPLARDPVAGEPEFDAPPPITIPQSNPPRRGRPKKKRLQGVNEDGTPMRKKQQCSGCGEEGHNCSTCPLKFLAEQS